MKTFEEKVKNMYLHQIVDAMLKGLEKEWVKIDFSDFGYAKHGICYGCAATNTVCEIVQRPITEQDIYLRKYFVGCSREFLANFEDAIDDLRMNDLTTFVTALKELGLKHSENFYKILEYAGKLPSLHNSNYKEDLHYYVALRDWLKKNKI